MPLTSLLPTAFSDRLRRVLGGAPFLGHLEYAVTEALEQIDALAPSPEARALRVRALQCRAALEACRRTPFGQELTTKLAVKVRGLERDLAALDRGSAEILAFFEGERLAS